MWITAVVSVSLVKNMPMTKKLVGREENEIKERRIEKKRKESQWEKTFDTESQQQTSSQHGGLHGQRVLYYKNTVCRFVSMGNTIAPSIVELQQSLIMRR